MLFRPPRPVGMSLNLAPMVDVMMCLIVFFLLASRLVDAQHRPVALPHAQSAEEVERSDLGTRVVINVRPDAEDTTLAEYVVNGWDGRNITERILSVPELESYLQARATQAAALDEEIRCVIRADKAVRYAHVEFVLRACGLAKIAKIVFSADAAPEGEAS